MKKQFIVTIEGDINEKYISCKESVENALENETQENYEGAIFDCSYTVEEIKEKQLSVAVLHCGECPHFLYEDTDGYGYCGLSNKERRCSQLCDGLERERVIMAKL